MMIVSVEVWATGYVTQGLAASPNPPFAPPPSFGDGGDATGERARNALPAVGGKARVRLALSCFAWICFCIASAAARHKNARSLLLTSFSVTATSLSGGSHGRPICCPGRPSAMGWITSLRVRVSLRLSRSDHLLKEIGNFHNRGVARALRVDGRSAYQERQQSSVERSTVLRGRLSVFSGRIE